jgi:D-3-phosphoglycerate dehydrogenase
MSTQSRRARRDGHALVLAPFSPEGIAMLASRVAVTHESWMDTLRLYDPDELAERINEAAVTALIVESDFVFAETFEQVSTLRFVGICRAALNHVDVDSATEHGVVVVNAPGRNSRAVAEHVIGLMLALARQIPAAHSYVKDGQWNSPDEPYRTLRGVELGGRTLGLVGFGAIGREVAYIASALGMDVLAHDPYVSEAPAGVTLADLDTLLAGSDFVATLAPLNPETTGMLDAQKLARMKQGAFLITASGVSITDQTALLAALRSGALRGAAVDVFDTHPVAPDSPLLTAENLLLTPHIAGATGETIERHSAMVAGDLVRFLDGLPPVNAVNPQALADD